MSATTKGEKNLNVVSFSLTDGSGNEVPVVALIAVPGEGLRLDELRQHELARDLEWHYRPPYVVAGDGE